MQSENMKATLAALRADGFMCDQNTCAHCLKQRFNLRKQNEISRAYDRGNYANAYEGQSIESFKIDAMPEHMRAAFVLGFYSSYELDEIVSDREIFDAAYWSTAGRYVVHVARYTDSRDDDYKAESDEF